MDGGATCTGPSVAAMLIEYVLMLCCIWQTSKVFLGCTEERGPMGILKAQF